MAKLTTKERKTMPASQFANGKKNDGMSGSYPIPDENHARLALAMVAKHGTLADKARVRAAVHAKYPDIDKPKMQSGMAATKATQTKLIHK